MYLLPPAKVNNSTWATWFPGCTINAGGRTTDDSKVEDKATSDANEENLELMLQAMMKHIADEGEVSRLNVQSFCSTEYYRWLVRKGGGKF